MVDYRVVEEPKDNDEIVIWGFDYIYFGEYGGVMIDQVSLFINVNVSITWVLVYSVVKD